MSQVTLNHPHHGTYTVDTAVLDTAVIRYGNASLMYVRKQAAGCCGYPEHQNAWLTGETALDDCTLIECLIIWIESGNHNFGRVRL